MSVVATFVGTSRHGYYRLVVVGRMCMSAVSIVFVVVFVVVTNRPASDIYRCLFRRSLLIREMCRLSIDARLNSTTS